MRHIESSLKRTIAVFPVTAIRRNRAFLVILIVLFPVHIVLAGQNMLFGPNEDWTNEAYYGSRGTFFADVTGEGCKDAIVVNRDTITVRPANCYEGFGLIRNEFLPNQDWTNGPYYGSRGTFFADVDGDRRADAIVVN